MFEPLQRPQDYEPESDNGTFGIHVGFVCLRSRPPRFRDNNEKKKITQHDSDAVDPTSHDGTGSDARSDDPDYSCVYITLHTDDPELTGILRDLGYSKDQVIKF